MENAVAATRFFVREKKGIRVFAYHSHQVTDAAPENISPPAAPNIASLDGESSSIDPSKSSQGTPPMTPAEVKNVCKPESEIKSSDELSEIISASWSPTGKQLAVVDSSSLRLIQKTGWTDGSEDSCENLWFPEGSSSLVSFRHTRHMSWSPLGSFLVAALNFSSVQPIMESAEHGLSQDVRNVFVWQTGGVSSPVASFSIRRPPQGQAPMRWRDDERYCCVFGRQELLVFDGRDMSGSPKVRVKTPRPCSTFSLSPARSLSSAIDLRLAYFVPATAAIEEAHAKVVLLSYARDTGQWHTEDEGRVPCDLADSGDVIFAPSGTALVVLAHTDVDTAGENYGGYSDAFLLRLDNGTWTFKKLNTASVQDVAWSPVRDEFILIEGKSPSAITLWDRDYNVLFQFPPAYRNTIRWEPSGTMVAIGGFGNLAGDLDLWYREPDAGLRWVADMREGCTVVCQWAPGGHALVLASTYPRMRVDNKCKVITNEGDHVETYKLDHILDVQWQPFSVIIPPRPPRSRERSSRKAVYRPRSWAQRSFDTAEDEGSEARRNALRSELDIGKPKQESDDATHSSTEAQRQQEPSLAAEEVSEPVGFTGAEHSSALTDASRLVAAQGDLLAMLRRVLPATSGIHIAGAHGFGTQILSSQTETGSFGWLPSSPVEEPASSSFMRAFTSHQLTTMAELQMQDQPSRACAEPSRISLQTARALHLGPIGSPFRQTVGVVDTLTVPTKHSAQGPTPISEPAPHPATDIMAGDPQGLEEMGEFPTFDNTTVSGPMESRPPLEPGVPQGMPQGFPSGMSARGMGPSVPPGAGQEKSHEQQRRLIALLHRLNHNMPQGGYAGRQPTKSAVAQRTMQQQSIVEMLKSTFRKAKIGAPMSPRDEQITAVLLQQVLQRPSSSQPSPHLDPTVIPEENRRLVAELDALHQQHSDIQQQMGATTGGRGRRSHVMDASGSSGASLDMSNLRPPQATSRQPFQPHHFGGIDGPSMQSASPDDAYSLQQRPAYGFLGPSQYAHQQGNSSQMANLGLLGSRGSPGDGSFGNSEMEVPAQMHHQMRTRQHVHTPLEAPHGDMTLYQAQQLRSKRMQFASQTGAFSDYEMGGAVAAAAAEYPNYGAGGLFPQQKPPGVPGAVQRLPLSRPHQLSPHAAAFTPASSAARRSPAAPSPFEADPSSSLRFHEARMLGGGASASGAES